MSGEALERVLAELEERTFKWKHNEWNGIEIEEKEVEKHGSFYLSKVESGEWRAVTQKEGMAATSRWRSPSRARWRSLTCGSTSRTPDPNARNLQTTAGDRVALLGAREAAYD